MWKWDGDECYAMSSLYFMICFILCLEILARSEVMLLSGTMVKIKSNTIY